MAHETFIEYKQSGFWIPESYIEVLSHFICNAFLKSDLHNFNENLVKIYKNCDSNTSGINAGMVTILFDAYIIEPNEINTMINVLQDTKKIIAALGSQLSIKYLNDLEEKKEDDYFKVSWSFPIQTQSLISTLNFMIQLLNESFPQENIEVHYAGFPGMSTSYITV
ncbi:hypothetical protein Q765_05075 [Flavobacterium rivuli WB 3.3-2 = DSM 21788]|uniref:Uncharacterized protein n=1 Tax=Flavobacterium rivuli WB 3.3-2 = DSM 21788 TaxID=1121895 RepID=A0A0A2M8S3_9FLAO|nr:hypothetical protein [Flavobacterium rivuli]KGO87858.1 hypothetical protein Q765_05075 [Flavobacterium rivuli WB 3.3-2 = DSM 21788]